MFQYSKCSLEKIRTTSGIRPYDIAACSDGALVYSDGIKMRVYKIKNDQTEEIIRLQR